VLLPDGTRIGRDGTVTLWSGVVIRPVPPGQLGQAPTTVAGTAPSTAPTSVPPATTAPATSVVPTSASASSGPTTVAQP
jgi:hypothetical protein